MSKNDVSRADDQVEILAPLTAYDAAYLWLPAELEVPLATFDDQLTQAARKHLAGREADGG